MNKKDIIDIVKAKNYPENEYWVTVGAGLVMHGVRAEAGDVDMGCTTSLAESLIQNGAKWQFLKDGTRRIEDGDTIELFENWLVDEIVLMDGVSVASVQSIRKQKVLLNREKDWKDIGLIDAFVAKGQ